MGVLNSLEAQRNGSTPYTSLQFDFAQPLTPEDRIIFSDLDNDDIVQVQAYRLLNGEYSLLSLEGWKHEPFSGETQRLPDSSWAAWDPSKGTLTASSASISNPINVLTPDQPVDRLVYTKLETEIGSTAIQIVEVSQLPVITSATTASAMEGKPFSYQIKTSNPPKGYGVLGLPKGLTANGKTGLISGTPTVEGTFHLTLKATNAVGTASAVLTLTIASNQPPVITSATTATAQVGRAFSYQIKATHFPTSYGVQGLPKGLAFDPQTGLISGKPTVAGTSTLTLVATNNVGKDTSPLTLTIKPPAPVITSAATAMATDGTAFSYQIAATNNPANYGVAGLPPGLHVDTAAGLISGTPEKAGEFMLTLKAANSGGVGTKTLDLTVAAVAPEITSAGAASGTVGAAFSYQITASHHPASFGALGLRSGLVVDAKTGVISGTPTAAGTFKLTIKATNSAGSGEKTLTVTIRSS